MKTSPDTPLLPPPPNSAPRPPIWRRTFDHIDDAPNEATPQGQSSIIAATLFMALSGLIVLGLVQAVAGRSSLHGWALLGTPFVAFISIGLFVQCAIHIVGAVRSRDTSTTETLFWTRWSAAGAKLLDLAVAATVGAVLVVWLMNIAQNPPQATTVIIVLLSAILVVLIWIVARIRA